MKESSPEDKQCLIPRLFYFHVNSRDVCFSQALTSLVTALMSKFWACEPGEVFFPTN